MESDISEYVKNPRQKKLFELLPKNCTISTKNDAIAWVDVFHIIKSIMDDYFAKNLKLEKEFQQLVVRENNILREANNTDYYIIDFEYQSKHGRFDLIALRCDSTPIDRKKPENCRLSIIEVKYGDASLTGKSGLIKHVDDAETFLSEKNRVNEFKNEMLNIFEQKRKLGLINFGKAKNINLVSTIKDDYKIEFIFIFAAHKQKSSFLNSEIKKITKMKNADLRFAQASFMGYALYKESMLELKKFRKMVI